MQDTNSTVFPWCAGCRLFNWREWAFNSTARESAMQSIGWGGGPQPFLLLGLGPDVCACLFSSHLLCLTPQFGALLVFVAVRQSLLRVEDYWEGYKLFCYSYYSHSVPHEVEFRRCKLGAFFWRPPLLFNPWHVFLLLVPCMRACTCYECLCLISSLPSLLQVSLYGAAMGHQAFLPTTQYAPRACSCSPL
jgi:hypothetical protein